MSGDHNQNQSDSGWRKRQIALDIKAENARELGLDYEPDKTIMEMAQEVDIKFKTDVFRSDFCDGVYEDDLEAFAALIRADEAEKHKWDIHSCGPTCKRYACVAMREAVQAEREACAKVCEDSVEYAADELARQIRARGNT